MHVELRAYEKAKIGWVGAKVVGVVNGEE